MSEGATAVWQRSWPAVALGLVTLSIHLVFNNGYGAFTDELYFIVCGMHPAFGYVDQPPLIPWIAGLSHAFFGTALLPLRLVPALAMSATVALTAEFARIIGGGRFAQWLAGLAVLFGGVFLVDGLLLLTDALQPLTWIGCGLCIVMIAKTRDERWWLVFGAIAGVSLLSKYLILFFLAGLAVGVVATPLRRSLAKPWIYLGAGVAFLIASPSFFWQWAHGFPFLTLGEAGMNGKNLPLTLLGFLGQQILFVGPATTPIWVAGLWRFAAKPNWPALRVFPIAYAAMAALFFFLHGKAYYIAPVFPILLAGGAVQVEAWLPWVWVQTAIDAAVFLTGAVFAPLALPILPPAHYAAYAHALGIPSDAASMERGAPSPLPIHLAGMIGWHEMAAKVTAVYRALPPDERRRAVFYGRDYGEAAALDLYGPALGGPPVIAGHNNYWLWGPKGFDGSVVIVLDGDVTPLMKNYRSITEVGRIDSPYAQSWEAHMPIYVLRGPHLPLGVLWPQLRYYE